MVLPEEEPIPSPPSPPPPDPVPRVAAVRRKLVYVPEAPVPDPPANAAATKGCVPAAMRDIAWRAAVLAAVLAAIIGYAMWYAPEEAGYGQTIDTNTNEAVQWPSLPSADTTPATLLYCHHVGDAAAEAWLSGRRRETQEDRLLTEATLTWRKHRCLAPPAAVIHAIDDTFARYLDTSPAPTRVSPRVEVDLVPRVTSAVVDRRGELYYRVIMWHGGAFQPTLVRHRELVGALETLSMRVNARFETEDYHRKLCVCPEHFGIVGSGLFFTPEPEGCPQPHDTVLRWRVLANVAHRGNDRTARHMESRVAFTTNVAEFPARVDQRIITNDTLRLLQHPSSAWFRAYDPAAFLAAATVERYDVTMKHQWDRPQIAASAQASRRGKAPAPAESPFMSTIRFEEAHAETYGLCTYRDVPQSLSLKCYYHCARLGDVMLGQPAAASEDAAERRARRTKGKGGA